MSFTETYTLDEDEERVLAALRTEVARWNRPAKVEVLAEEVGIGRARALRAVRRLVELRLARRLKGSYGRIRYDLTSLGAASTAGR